MLGFLAGVVWFVLARTLLYAPELTHYHANFALYINNEREQFEEFTFYEEVEQCAADGLSPKRRVHMHDNENSVVHVHDSEVTWGHFFANLGFTLGDELVATKTGVFANQGDYKLRFMLNGRETALMSNQIIGDEDQLLVSYGDIDDELLEAQYKSIESTAGSYNHEADPAACRGSQSDGFMGRLKNTLGL